MEIVWIVLKAAAVITGIVGGGFGFVTYFSSTAKSIRKSDARAKETLAYGESIKLLLKWKTELEKEIGNLQLQVRTLLVESGKDKQLMDALLSIIGSAFSCKYNKENTDNCPVCIKKREIDLENKKS